MTSQSLQGKVAVVTGAAGKGMGRSIALTLSREGARVVLNHRTSHEVAGRIAEHIRSRSGETVTVQADVFEEAGCRILYESSCQAFGRVDICVIGPGSGWHPEPPERLNVRGALSDIQQELAPIYHLLPLVLPGMYERGWGRIVAIGLEPTKSSPSYAYNVAKAAREQALLLAKGAAWQNNVTLNIVSPGPVGEIPSLDEAIALCDHGPAWENRANLTAQDVAEGVAFLCSEAGCFISGCVLPYLFH